VLSKFASLLKTAGKEVCEKKRFLFCYDESKEKTVLLFKKEGAYMRVERCET